MLEIILGLAAAAFYGAGDFCGGLATKRTTMLSVTVISQSAGLLLLVIVLHFFHGHFAASDYIWAILAGICGALGIALLYHALSIGKMGVVSPITAVLAATVPVVYGFVSGNRIAPVPSVGIAVALLAVVLISMSFEEGGTREFSTLGVKEAVASGLILGGFYVFLTHAHASVGLDQLFVSRIASIALLLVLAAATRTSLVPRNGTAPLIILSGAMDMSANILFVLAAFNGALAIAAVLTSLYPASTVILARIVLKERLQRVQLIGVAAALIGVALIAS